MVEWNVRHEGNHLLSSEGHRLDPPDWEAFRAEFHRLADTCIDRMQAARELPWQPKPDDIAKRVALGRGSDVFRRMSEDIMPFATGNTHPRFWGWVHGTGQPVSVAAEMIAATMNSNLGGRDHGATEVEKAVIDWLRELAGQPHMASGLLTSGTSQATIIALCAARLRMFGDVRSSGIADLPRIRVYIAEGGHSCVAKALEVMGHGSGSLFKVTLTDTGQMDLDCLSDAVDLDRSEGIRPLAVVGTVGSVNTGTFDPFSELAEFCAERNIWLHADSAFGFWTLLADEPWRSLPNGIGRADSIATDFHKWIGVPYECGACLIADGDLHRRTFSSRPEYLVGQNAGLAGGDLWYTDYGIELSRGFRALKVWAAIEALGRQALGAAITDNCRQAELMGQLVERSEWLDLAHPVVSCLCCFTPRYGEPAEIAAKLQLSGEAVFSTTVINGRSCLRAAIVNHRTTSNDVRVAIKAVEREVIELR